LKDIIPVNTQYMC